MRRGRPIGLIDEDQRTHIVVRDHLTATALCERGVIVRRLPGEFEPGEPLNCARCEELNAEPG